jgi:hypothetical protein
LSTNAVIRLPLVAAAVAVGVAVVGDERVVAVVHDDPQLGRPRHEGQALGVAQPAGEQLAGRRWCPAAS